MPFADGQIFGKSGKKRMQVLHDFSADSRWKLSDLDIGVFRELLRCNVPRLISSFNQKNLLVFTDACYDPGDSPWPCGVGVPS